MPCATPAAVQAVSVTVLAILQNITEQHAFVKLGG